MPSTKPRRPEPPGASATLEPRGPSSEDANGPAGDSSARTPTSSGEAPCPDSLDADWQHQINLWLRDWGVEELENPLLVRFNPRLRRSLGRFRLASGRIELAGWLSQAPVAILREVLCHEAAHAAVHRLHGRCRPHGPEWKRLMRRAGFEPRRQLPSEVLPVELRHHVRPSLPWNHRCPGCGASRRGRRATPGWRCSRCIAAGFDGRLVITRFSARPKPQCVGNVTYADVLTDVSPDA